MRYTIKYIIIVGKSGDKPLFYYKKLSCVYSSYNKYT